MEKTTVRLALDEFLADPFGALRRARQAGWLVDADPVVAVVTYDDVRALLADPRLHANFPQFLRTFGITSGVFYEWMSRSPLNRDGEDHRRWRSLLSRTFTPRRVEQIRPFLRDAAHSLIDGFADRGTCEFVGAFADPYPSLGMCELIGVPSEDRDRFRDWANTIGLGFSPVELVMRIRDVDEALTQLLAYASELVAERRVAPRDDLVTRMAQAGAEEGWSEEDIVGALAGLVFAGHETTKNQLGWTLAVLAERTDVWDAVGRGELDAAIVVEEVLRLRSTATGVGRTVAEPIEHKGERLEAGTNLLLSLWGADHDDAVFAAPEHLDVEHVRDIPHLAFGHGAHHCLGASLARAELQEALVALTARLGCPRLEAGALWKPAVGINGPLALPISFAPRSQPK